MGLFHLHVWRETRRYFVKPTDVNRDVEAKGPVALLILEGMVHGFTVVELRCNECGDVAFRKSLGNLRPSGAISGCVE